MLFTFGLLFQVVVAPYASMPGAKAQPTDRLTDSLRAAEAKFLSTWRNEWTLARKARPSMMRLAALHCHYDNSWAGGAPNIIRGEQSSRSFCPVWFPPDDSLPNDEAQGVDASLNDDSRLLIRRQRGQLIDRFRAAMEARPEDPWIAGQLVRLHIDQRDRSAALGTAQQCRASTPWCLLLEGYVRHEGGDGLAADSVFSRALTAMPPGDRCEWTSVAALLDAKDREAYLRTPCDVRDSLNATFWWLADPLYLEPGNSRRAEHFARQVLVRLHAALPADERWDWRLQYSGDALATMLIKYGWPSYLYWAGRMEDGGHFDWLGFKDNSVNVAAEYTLPRFHTTPPWHAVLDPMALTASDWTSFAPKPAHGAADWDVGKFPVEHAPRAAGALLELPEQTVIFRRDHDGLLAIGLDMPPRFLTPGVRVPYDAAIIQARDANDRWTPARTSVALDGSSTAVLVSRISARAQVVSAELVPADGLPGTAARARRAVQPPPPLSVLRAGELGISDPLFFRPADDGTTSLSAEDAISRMYGSLSLTGTRVGIFWETYGFPATDTVETTLRLTSEDKPGILRRLGSSIGVLSAEGGEISVRWQDPRVGERSGISYAGDVPIQARSVVLDISPLKAGRYTLEVSVTRRGRPTVSSSREIRVVR